METTLDVSRDGLDFSAQNLRGLFRSLCPSLFSHPDPWLTFLLRFDQIRLGAVCSGSASRWEVVLRRDAQPVSHIQPDFIQNIPPLRFTL